MKSFQSKQKETIRLKANRLPEGWSLESFSNVVEINSNTLSANTPDDYSFYYLSLSDVNSGVINHPAVKICFKSAPERARRIVKQGDILLSTVRPNLQGFGYVDFNGDDYVCSTGFAVLRPKTNVVGQYIYQFLYSQQVTQYFYSCIVGSNYPAINNSDIERISLPLPPIDEQKKISQILSTWERAIERVQRLIEARQQQKDRLVTQLVSGKMRFPGFQDEWKQVKLGAFLHPKFRKVVKPEGSYLRLGIRSHGKGTFTSVVDDPETIALTHLFQARKDDLIVNITFAWEGAIALVGPDGDGALVSHRFPTYVFDTSKMLPEYFKHLMVTDRFFHELDLISPGGAGRNRVMNKGDFLKILVTIPGVEEQKKFAGVLGGMDEQIALLKKYLERLNEQKKGLMQKLLTGEIRVKVDLERKNDHFQ